VRHHTSRPVRPQRRKLIWADSSGFVTPVGNNPGTNFDILANFRGNSGVTQGCTIIRTHLTLNTRIAAAAYTDAVDVALAVDTLQATSVTLNTTHAYADWMIFKRLYAGAGGIVEGGTTQAFYEIDLKAKRKLDEVGQTLWLCLLQNSVNAWSVAWHSRVLLALP